MIALLLGQPDGAEKVWEVDVGARYALPREKEREGSPVTASTWRSSRCSHTGGPLRPHPVEGRRGGTVAEHGLRSLGLRPSTTAHELCDPGRPT